MRKVETKTAPTEFEHDRFLTREQAAQLIGFTGHHLANLALRDAGPPFHKHGTGRRGRVVYSRAELLAWVRSLPRHGGGAA